MITINSLDIRILKILKNHPGITESEIFQHSKMKDKDTVILRIGLLAQGSQPYLEYKTIKSTDDIGATIYEETEKIQITSLGIKTLEDDHQQHIEYWKNFFIKSFATPIIVAIITSILTIYTSKVLGWLL